MSPQRAKLATFTRKAIGQKNEENKWVAYAIHEDHVSLMLADGGVDFGACYAYMFWSTGGNVCVQANKDARMRPQVMQEKVSVLLKALTLDAYAGVNEYEAERI